MFRRSRRAVCLAQAATLCFGLVALAPIANAQWLFLPRVATGAVATDNVALQPRGLEQDEIAVRVNPAFQLQKQGGRLDLELDYSLDALFYSQDSDRNESFHNLVAQAEFEVLPQRFFIAGSSTYDQAIINATEPIPLSNVSISTNRADYWSLDVNPYWVEDFGAWSRLRADYRYGKVNYANVDLSLGGNIDDLERTEYTFALGSQPDRSGLTWGIEYRNQSIDYATFGGFELDSAIADLRLPVGSRLALIVRGGAETDARTNSRDGGLQSELYEAGLRYDLGRDQYAELRAGRRFFGDTYFAAIIKTVGRLQANIQYNETPTTVGLEQLLLPDVVGGPGGVGFELTDLTNQLYVNKELLIAVNYATPRTTVDARVRSIRREFFDSGNDDEERGIGLTVGYRLGPRTSVELYLYRADIGFPGTTVQDRLFQGVLTASRQFGRQTLLELSVRRDRRDSDTVQQANVYRENAVELMLTRWFGRAEAEERGRGRSVRSIRR